MSPVQYAMLEGLGIFYILFAVGTALKLIKRFVGNPSYSDEESYRLDAEERLIEFYRIEERTDDELACICAPKPTYREMKESREQHERNLELGVYDV